MVQEWRRARYNEKIRYKYTNEMIDEIQRNRTKKNNAGSVVRAKCLGTDRFPFSDTSTVSTVKGGVTV